MAMAYSCALLVLTLWLHYGWASAGGNERFVRAEGSQFALNGRPLFVNGFNAYYMTVASVDPSSRPTVSHLLKEASSAGLTLARTWAFNDDAHYRPLQTAPGVFDETVFQALDFVVSEAKANGIWLILSLSNNYPSMGGKSRYVEWAKQVGQSVSGDEAFFYDPTIKSYFKNYIKKVVTRVNTITGVAYKDDPTIFAWELMNEPRSEDATGNTLQAWIEEMATYVKSIDNNHMLEVGLEGFFGPSTSSRYLKANPPGFSSNEGSDFMRNNIISSIDFATVHSYPDQWLPNASFGERMSFLKKWASCHLRVGRRILKKPVLFAEFGLSKQDPGYSVGNRDALISTLYDFIYASASKGGAAGGGLLWQMFPSSSNNLVSSYGDGYSIVLSQDTSTANIITNQSRKISYLTSTSSLVQRP